MKAEQFRMVHNGDYLDMSQGDKTLKELYFFEPTDIVIIEAAPPEGNKPVLPSFVAEIERKLTIAQLKKVSKTTTTSFF